jgi:putative restriction endonuclease
MNESGYRMAQQIFGHIPPYPEGSCFASREELSRAGVHRPRLAGIAGRGREGAESIVLSGGYEDDHDFGDVIIYTGQGGRDPATGLQVRGQTLTGWNLALARNSLSGFPVRVIRGAAHRSPYSPATGYRYDGLYRVEDYWRERGKSGYAIWRYRLVKQVSLDQTGATVCIIRETAAGSLVKALYHYRCQVCRERIEGNAGPYAEAVHIRPMAPPHDGPDDAENILCLCPNHAVGFSIGGLSVADDFRLIGEEGHLMVDFRHRINKDHLCYHRLHYPIDPHED